MFYKNDLYNHHQKLSNSYIPVMFSTIKTPISFATGGRLSHRTDGTNPANGGGTATTDLFLQASSY